MLRTRIGRGVAVFAFAVFFAAIGAATALAAQTYMLNARADLNSAISQLNRADSNKGGHRKNAINLVNQAIGEINAGIAYANAHR
jgi:hypothetical protein